MARRISALLLAFALLLFCGCGQQPSSKDMVHPIRFYYKVTDDRYEATGQAMECEWFETQGHKDDYPWILNAYFDGPSGQQLLAPFPKSLELLSVQRDGESLRVNVSEELSQLSGIDLTMACSCITLTCLELDGIETVSITANGASMDGRMAVIMTREDLLLEDAGSDDTSMYYLLYFSDTDNRYLISEQLRVENDHVSLTQLLLHGLLQGPGDSGLAQTIPMDTEVRNIQIDAGVCHLDLSRAFLENAPKTELAQRMTILSLTNTLTQLDEIDSLVLYLEGMRLDRYGALDLSEPLTFDSAAVGPARTSLNERDMDIYLYSGDREILSKVPVRVRQTPDKLAVESVLLELLAYGRRNGYNTAIPVEAKLLELYTEENTCVVVLSQDSVDNTDSLERMFRSIWATVLASGDYEAVRVAVEGYAPNEAYAHLFAAVTWDDSWFSSP